MRLRRVSAVPAVGSLCWAEPSCLAADSSSAPAPARSGKTQTTPTPAILHCRANQCHTRPFKTSSALPHHGHRREPASEQPAQQQPTGVMLHWTAKLHVFSHLSILYPKASLHRMNKYKHNTHTSVQQPMTGQHSFARTNQASAHSKWLTGQTVWSLRWS